MMRADPDDDAPDELIVVVRVERTGGIAGLRREWTAEPPPDEAPRWIGLIEGCPWDATADDRGTTGADRYQWRIVARLADEPPRRAELPDDRLQGPWRELVDQVRAFGRSERPHAPTPDGPAPARPESPGPTDPDPVRRENLTS